MFKQELESPKSSREFPPSTERPVTPLVPPITVENWNGILVPSAWVPRLNQGQLPHTLPHPYMMQPQGNQGPVAAPPALPPLPPIASNSNNANNANNGPLVRLTKDNQKVFRLAEENHGNNINNAFEIFRQKKLFLDINLLVQGHNFLAHKLILCAASPYFKKRILSIQIPNGQGSPEQNFICIVIERHTPGVIKFLLDYIYRGEVTVPESELSDVLKAADDLQISGLFSGEKFKAAIEKVNGEVKAAPHNAIAKSPRASMSRPSSGGSSQSSGSVKTGSSRKKGIPKKLKLHTQTPPESQSPSPDSYYANSNDSPSAADETRRQTPSSHSSHEDGPLPMDFSRSASSKDDDSEERPLVISEPVAAPEVKRPRQEAPQPPAMPPLSVPPTTVAAANQFLQSMKQAWMSSGAAGGSNFSMMQAALGGATGADANSSSSESSRPDHDSERDDQPKSGIPRMPPHPALPGMNPQDMIAKLQQAFMNNAASGAAFPYPLGGAPGASPSSLLAQVSSMAGLPVTSASGFPPLLPPPTSQGVNISPNRSGDFTNTPPSTSRGIPAGIGPNGKPAVSCEICGKTLADPSSLYRHRKIHNGEKPHKCPFCGRKFIQRYNMTQHIKTHFKPRGINSLANNPATLANFLTSNRSALSNYQIPEDMLTGLVNGQGFEPEDLDTNRYDEETPNQSMADDSNVKDDTQEEIDPC